MKIKKLTVLQRLSVIVPFVLVVASLLMFSKSYFNSKEIGAFSDSCFNVDGEPAVEMTFLNLDYSFSCESR